MSIVEGSQSHASDPNDLRGRSDFKELDGLAQVDKRLWSWRIGFLAYLALFVVAGLLDRPFWWILPAGMLVTQTALFTLRHGWGGIAALLGISKGDRS